MALRPVVLDTDIIFAIMREDPVVLSKALAYLMEHRRFTLSVITRYEILRGLEAKQARRQIADFEALCNQSTILPLTEDAVAKAAEIYGDLTRRGQLVGDADILIAASALVHGLAVVTNNERHFHRIKGLQVENWTK